MSRSSRRALVGAVVAGLLMMGVAGSSALAASSEASTTAPPKPPPTYDWTDPPQDVQAWQRENQVADLAQRLVPDDAAPGSGYAGMIVSGKDLTIHMWWKGPVPDRVRALADDPNDAVNVDVAPAPYSRNDLRSAIARLMPSSDRRLSEGNISVEAAGLDDRGRGITVAYKVIDSGKTAPSAPNVTLLLEQVSGIPVLGAKVAAPTGYASRQNDSPPWWGGSTLINASGTLCSTGFAGSRNSDGGSVMLSAAHCSDWGTDQSYWYDGTRANGATGELVSTYANFSVVSALDSMSMKTQGGSDPHVYGAGWSTTGGTRYALDVIGSFTNQTGRQVCTSGANSGEHCNITLTQAYIYMCGAANNIQCEQWEGYNNSSTDYIVVQGDSGGPVYQNTGQGNVRAQGIITRYGSSYDSRSRVYDCSDLGGTRIRFGQRYCSNVVGFIDVQKVLSQRGITLKTRS